MLGRTVRGGTGGGGASTLCPVPLPPTTRRSLAAALAVLGLLLLGSTSAAADQVLVQVEPGNGESLERAPERLVLTFAEPLAEAQVTVALSTPEGNEDVTPRVEGRTVVVGMPDAGPGAYELRYQVTPGQAQGSTGFTVREPGQSAPEDPAASPWWFITGAALLVLLALVLVRTVRGLRQR